MAFPTSQNQIATSIGTMLITFEDPDGVPANRKARFSIEVLDQNGAIKEVLPGDLVPHLSASQISALQSFLTTLRTQAVNQVLP